MCKGKKMDARGLKFMHKKRRKMGGTTSPKIHSGKNFVWEMNQVQKYECAVKLLKELNCPRAILDMLWLFGMTVRNDQVKLHNWQALSEGGMVEGECREVKEFTEGGGISE